MGRGNAWTFFFYSLVWGRHIWNKALNHYQVITFEFQLELNRQMKVLKPTPQILNTGVSHSHASHGYDTNTPQGISHRMSTAHQRLELIENCDAFSCISPLWHHHPHFVNRKSQRSDF